MKDPYGRKYTRDVLLARVADVLARSGVEDAGHLMDALQRVVPDDLPTSLLKALYRAQMNEADHRGLVFVANRNGFAMLQRIYRPTGGRFEVSSEARIFDTEVLVVDRFGDDGDRLPGSQDHIRRSAMPATDGLFGTHREIVVEYWRGRG